MTGIPNLRGTYRTDIRARAAYAEGAGIYRILPSAVARPADQEDLATLIRWAEATGTGLIPRGAGSGIPGGSIGPGVVVDLRDYVPSRLEIDPEQRTALTGAGVSLRELNDAAARHGLRLPPDPSSGSWATLGGMVATNASGARSLRYGSVRRWVNHLELVGKEGRVMRPSRRSGGPAKAPSAKTRAVIQTHFPKTRKNSSGYALDAWLESGDLVDLLVGSEGTLGFFTEIGWRLDEIPPARTGLLASLGSLDALEAAVQAVNRCNPSAVELLDRTFLDLVALAGRESPLPQTSPGTQAVLLIEFERDNEKAALGAAGDAARALGAIATQVETAVSPVERERLWTLRHAASPILAGLSNDRRSMQVIEDGCVPLPRLGEYIRFLRETAEAQDLTVVIFGHAGDGNVHVNVLPELTRRGWAERVTTLFEAVNAEILRLGGTLSGEHGDGRLRAGWLGRQYGPDVLELFRGIKTQFDPHGIFNPGVILSEPVSAIRQLKVGPDAEPLPDDIAAALREIERGGGYAVDRLEIADNNWGDGRQ
ncbi:MAG TPA: FAD-binding oxidoreductase [Gemmatimonadales bacterium]|nr:FAD-binding oxidoreductase [Gemmatimonadales bacterium]